MAGDGKLATASRGAGHGPWQPSRVDRFGGGQSPPAPNVRVVLGDVAVLTTVEVPEVDRVGPALLVRLGVRAVELPRAGPSRAGHRLDRVELPHDVLALVRAHRTLGELLGGVRLVREGGGGGGLPRRQPQPTFATVGPPDCHRRHCHRRRQLSRRRPSPPPPHPPSGTFFSSSFSSFTTRLRPLRIIRRCSRLVNLKSMVWSCFFLDC